MILIVNRCAYYRGEKFFMKNSIQKQFILTIVSIFVMLASMVIYTLISFYNSSVERIEEIGKQSLISESVQIENYLNRGMDILWVTADTVNNMLENHATSTDILQYLRAEADHQHAQVDENFTGIYGYIGGEYLDGIGWVPPEGYVPKEREWYVAAVEAGGKPTIVAPYLDAQTNTIMISVSQLLADGESVVSLDIALNEVQYITENITLEDMGYGFIIDKNGLVIAHFDAGEKGKVYPLNEEQNQLITGIYDESEENFEMMINGEKCRVFSNKVMDEWYVVMIVSDARLFQNLRRQIAMNAGISLLAYLIIVVFCVVAYHGMYEHQKRDSENKERLNRLNANIVRALAYTIDAKDRYTSGHSQRVANYSMELAKRMGKSAEEQRLVYYAGLLHDVGKIRVPEDVINKPGKLTEEEFNQIKMHPISGYHILKDIYEDNRIAIGARYHHERYDGNGYPNGLAGENIPEIARIIGVADAYDAMASNRSYRAALPQEVVRSEIENGRGGQFDPVVADIMLQMMDEDPEYTMRQLESVQKKVLVVDDEDGNIKMIERILKDEEVYQILAAHSCSEAVEQLKKHNVDIVLLDSKVQEMSGLEVLRYIRGVRDVPVVLMTGDKSFETIQKAIETGIDDYVSKTFLPIALKETIHGIVSSWS